ncbi:MAG: DNA primase [Lachnospiraceae bacterium]|nr:DNA primase [Lachnospiraceae bacterium]
MRYPDEVVEEVRSRNDIVDVISSYVHLKKQGSNYFGLCPFHNEKSPSFSVSPQKQIYYCFGCGAGGNVFGFIQNYENYTFPEALKLLADRVGYVLPEVKYSEENRKRETLKSRMLEVNKEAAKFYYVQLRSEEGKAAWKYFKDRGLNDEIMQKFGLGFARTGRNLLYRYLKDKGFEDEILRQCGIFTFDEKNGVTDKFWSRVIFPIMDVNHRVIGFGGRTMGDAKPKYINSPETLIFDKGRNLYGLNLARTSRKKNLILCEGYMDVIAMHQAGFNQAVAALGTSFTSGQANLLRRYTEEVLMIFDSDDAGVKAGTRAIPILKEAGLSGRVVDLSPYKDPDLFILNEGAEAFQQRLDQAENAFFWEIRMLERGYDLNDPQDRTRFAEETARKMLRFEEQIERDNYIDAVCDKYHMNRDSFRKLVAKYAMKNEGITIREPVKSGIRQEEKTDDGILAAQRMMLCWFVDKPQIYQVAKPYLTAEDFSTKLYTEVAKALFAQLEEGTPNPASIISRFEDEEEQKEAARIFQTELPDDIGAEEKEQILRELLINIRSNSSRLHPKEESGKVLSLEEMIRFKKETEALNSLRFHIQ